MVDQNTFMETVRAVAEIIRTSETALSEAEILGYFDDMELSEEQKKIVMKYLKNPQGREQEDITEDEEAGRPLREDSGEPEADEQPASEQETEKNTERSAVFGMYLEELSGIPKYSEGEKKKLYEALSQGDTQVISDLSNVWLNRVIEIAEQYRAPKLHVEDLIQEGNMALLIKLQELCGAGRECDAEDVLEQAVEEGIAQYASRSNGERELENAVLGRVNLVHEARKLLTEENGKLPTAEELSAYTKMPVEELNDIVDMIESVKENRR